MIIIKPDLVIKWANTNLVLHRVREHLCVFLRIPVSPYIFTFLNILVIVLESLCLNMHTHCVCVCVSGESAAEEKHIWEGLVQHGDCYHLPSGKKKKKKKKHKHSPINSFSPPHSLSCTHSLQLSPSLFLYHLQRQPFPPKWGHVRKVCKWNHCSWIRMGHHIP